MKTKVLDRGLNKIIAIVCGRGKVKTEFLSDGTVVDGCRSSLNDRD